MGISRSCEAPKEPHEWRTTSEVQVKIEGGGSGAAGHVGLHLLGVFADRLGLAKSLTTVLPWTGERNPGNDGASC